MITIDGGILIISLSPQPVDCQLPASGEAIATLRRWYIIVSVPSGWLRLKHQYAFHRKPCISTIELVAINYKSRIFARHARINIRHFAFDVVLPCLLISFFFQRADFLSWFLVWALMASYFQHGFLLCFYSVWGHGSAIFDSWQVTALARWLECEAPMNAEASRLASCRRGRECAIWNITMTICQPYNVIS